MSNRYKGLLRPVAAKYLPHLGLEDQRKDYPRELHNRMLRALRGSITAAWSDQHFAALGRLDIVDEGAIRSKVNSGAGKSFEELGAMFMALSEERWIGTHTSA